MQFIPGDAILVVYAGGKQCGIDLRAVAEICGIDSMQERSSSAGRAAVFMRNGVQVPVYDLGAALGTLAGQPAEAVVVLDLPDRIAAVVVDAVCEVRIVPGRPLPASVDAHGMDDRMGQVAASGGAEVPVLDITSWLRDREFQCPDSTAR